MILKIGTGLSGEHKKMSWLGKQKAKGKDKEFRVLTSIWVGSWGKQSINPAMTRNPRR